MVDDRRSGHDGIDDRLEVLVRRIVFISREDAVAAFDLLNGDETLAGMHQGAGGEAHLRYLDFIGPVLADDGHVPEEARGTFEFPFHRRQFFERRGVLQRADTDEHRTDLEQYFPADLAFLED